ncbi:hypothetical protein SEA_KELCOLE_3 [Microbacterium phage Kelcole]|nr:hypothetical protein SEA_KELCOLE_3 [Microbacterium phage Kelcole]
MKFTLGFLAGLGTAWAALAIWQHRLVETRTIDLDVLTEEPDLRTEEPDASTPWWMRAPSPSSVEIASTDMRCNFEWKSMSMGRVQCSRRYPGHGPRHTHGAAWITVGSETMPLIEGRWLQ